MFSSSRPFRFLALAAAAVCLAAATSFEDIAVRAHDSFERAIASLRSMRERFLSIVVEPLREAFKRSQLWLTLRALWPAMRARASQYVLRQADRPRIFPGWRMVPST